MQDNDLLESILSSLSNEVRVEILKLISREGALSFTEIMEKLQMDPKSDAGKFGYHLRMLTEADLIKSDESSGKYYLTLLGQEVSNFIYGVEDAIRRKKGDMLVRTSSLTIEPFDRKKIIDALVREANVPRKLADTISKEAEDRLKKLQVKYLTAALIREFVNAILLEKGLEEYRHVLTRLGQPVYDVTMSIKNARLHGYPTPETIHSMAGDAVLEEYMLLKVLPRTIADAHLCGAIHLNNANYWVLRPANIFHDIRPILSGKIACDGSGLILPHYSVPKSFRGALHAINCLLKASSSFVSNSQSIPFFNIFLAPYIKKISKEEMCDALREFFYNLNILLGDSLRPQICLDLELGIPPFLENVKYVGPDGNIGTYGDMFNESIALLSSIIEVLKEPDGVSKPLLNPALFIKIRKKSLFLEELQNSLMASYELARVWGNVYFVNQTPPWQTENVAYSLDLSRVDSDWKDWEYGTLRVGVLDNVTINLPRIAYESKGDDDRLKERVRELLELSREALYIKKQVLEERISSDKILPLFKEPVEGSSYFRLSDSLGIISYVGLPEAIKYHTGFEITDNEDALKLAKDLISIIDRYANQVSPSLRLAASSTTFEPAAKRLTNLDYVGGYLKSKDSKCYTEHSNLPLNTAIELKTRLKIEEEFQQLTKGGHLFDVRLSEPFPTEQVLANYTKRIVETTRLGLFTFTRDFTYCWQCKFISYGFYSKCPECGYDGDRLVMYTKVFGKIKPSLVWSPEEKDFALTTQHFVL
ncbi:MAG: helix-turn-helix domain-containing protein [Candidatus Methanomethyliales bacterium]|nr:helix-turn-helix domain-containing protein [Candidatus Methanomethylicales archaeon]